MKPRRFQSSDIAASRRTALPVRIPQGRAISFIDKKFRCVHLRPKKCLSINLTSPPADFPPKGKGTVSQAAPSGCTLKSGIGVEPLPRGFRDQCGSG
ncbi:hypothetical protein TRIP_B330044 [uncultured Desulfatiglans sp.]|uniref:Uncharacterized protein n=1 Tax=Uncultured Desulfatiglans sp. TaxID=1748965 RepID=A0A653A790_UNCDX|nr:hypothetical protein TRIP_B330044 [uncultured Desulfatiglans sp.]